MTFKEARYSLFLHVAKTHAVCLTESEMDDIECLAVRVATARGSDFVPKADLDAAKQRFDAIAIQMRAENDKLREQVKPLVKAIETCRKLIAKGDREEEIYQHCQQALAHAKQIGL